MFLGYFQLAAVVAVVQKQDSQSDALPQVVVKSRISNEATSQIAAPESRVFNNWFGGSDAQNEQ